jgi:hypothetical protein
MKVLNMRGRHFVVPKGAVYVGRRDPWGRISLQHAPLMQALNGFRGPGTSVRSWRHMSAIRAICPKYLSCT